MNNNEIETIQKAARIGIELGNGDMAHLSNRVIISGYARIAGEVAAYMHGKKLLDWGCGYGQMTILLGNRGVIPVPYDVIKRPNISKLPLFSGVKITYGDQESALPFEAPSFDGVLSCGTIEHVPDREGSLKE